MQDWFDDLRDGGAMPVLKPLRTAVPQAVLGAALMEEIRRHQEHPLFDDPEGPSPYPISFRHVEAHAEGIRAAAADLAAFATGAQELFRLVWACRTFLHACGGIPAQIPYEDVKLDVFESL
ncbi:hypothetical protein ABZY31_28290 [Streptomyces sp. NPDC006529]|uniref:hypothetical protein n=1 Tax=Streptomyces sp. NPDC006529 TaxID=3157177 RepID=UPI0033A76FC5